MALVITPSKVNCSFGGKLEIGVAGQTITAGQTVYYDTTNGVFRLPIANNTPNADVVAGIAQSNAWNGQSFMYCTSDPSFAIGNLSLDPGTIIVQDTAAGGIEVSTNVTGTDSYITVLGVITAGGRANLSLISSNTPIP